MLNIITKDNACVAQDGLDPKSLASISVHAFVNLYKSRVSSVAVKLGSLPRERGEG